MRRPTVLSRLLLAQGTYYMVSGIWPLLSMRSFLAVTGPKADLWLVRTVAALVTAIGGALTLAGIRRQVSPEVALLATGSAAGLAAVETYYGGRRRISFVYLLDALLEVALIGAWLYAFVRPNPAPERLSTQ